MHAASMSMGLSAGLGLLMVAAAVWFTTAANAKEGAQPSSFAGIRTARTTASPKAWVAGHRAALPAARRLSLFSAVMAVVLVLTPALGGEGDAPNAATWAAFIIGFGGVTVGAFMLASVAGRGAAEADGRGPHRRR
ncbi:MAG: SdpI family protein [Mobilicoccus sp.]|nr:SdpI family protein [Mobilicoccus sp.]